ncbi:MAG: HK97 gp10 family phage protein [Pseudoxanthomonas sp.]|nr:HK97 gp10 family phage protein [Pseudoxanthomonas sp.]
MASDSPQVFALRLNELIEQAKAAPDQVVRKVGLQIGARLVEQSPVDTGRFRANWNVAFGRIDPLTTPSTDKGGGQTKERIRVLLNGWPVGSDIYFTNSLPYAIPLEYGHSKQAPLGMVRITVAEFQTFVDSAIKSLPQ